MEGGEWVYLKNNMGRVKCNRAGYNKTALLGDHNLLDLGKTHDEHASSLRTGFHAVPTPLMLLPLLQGGRQHMFSRALMISTHASARFSRSRIERVDPLIAVWLRG